MAYLFNGSTHTINRADAALQSWPITMHGRIRLTSVNDGLVHCIMGLWESGADNGFRLQVELNGGVMKARCGSKASGAASNANTSTSIGDTNWHSVVGEISAANARQVWLDNGGNGTNTTSLTPGTLTKTSIGAHDNGGTLSGNIAHELADIAVWAGTLTNEERAALAAGVSPALIRPDILKIYLPLIGGGVDQRGAEFTVTGATVAVHPAVFMPARAQWPGKSQSGLNGTASITEASDTLSATGVLGIAGQLGISESGDSLSASGTLAVAGTLSSTESGDALAASGVLEISGALALTEASDTLSASGTSISGGIGTLNVAEDGDTLASAGALQVAGAFARVEADDGLASASRLSISGALGCIEASDTLSATGTLAILAQIAANENGDSLSAVIQLSGQTGSRFTANRPTPGMPILRANRSSGHRPRAISGA